MIGAIAGDIIGSQWEMKFEVPKDFEFFTPKCRFTDDTVLLMATIRTLLQNPKANRADFAKQYQSYHERYPNRGYGSGFRTWANGYIFRKKRSVTNGCAMRVPPVGYVAESLQEAMELACDTSYYSHFGKIPFNAVRVVAGSIFLARQKDKEGIEKLACERYGFDFSWEPADYYAENKPSACVASVPLALKAFCQTSSYEEAVRTAVCYGGDTDTLAVIAGAIAEAYYEHVPEWIQKDALTYLPEEFIVDLDEFKDRYQSA